MRKFRLVRDHTNYPFMWLRRYNFPVSALLSILSLIAFFTIGPNYGIDFRGGTLIEVKPIEASYDIAKIRSTVESLHLGDVQVTEVSDVGSQTSVLIRIQQQEGGETAQQAAVEKVRTAFGNAVEFRRVESVGPRVSGELASAGMIALLVTLVGILIYIWFRFEWQFAIGAIVATLHDVFMTLGFYVVSQVDFSLSSVAAILTIVGYSLNDTVVVYDRIRENLRKYKKMPIAQLLDRAVNETLSRTTITSLTTFLALLALFIFGGSVIRSFVAAMLFGVIVGTYSSIYIAAPILIYFKLRPGGPAIEGTEASDVAEAPSKA
jgi:preprotein translocase SecF subunit